MAVGAGKVDYIAAACSVWDGNNSLNNLLFVDTTEVDDENIAADVN